MSIFEHLEGGEGEDSGYSSETNRWPPPGVCVEFCIPARVTCFYSQERVPTASHVPHVPGKQDSPAAPSQLCLWVSAVCSESPKPSVHHHWPGKSPPIRGFPPREVAPARDWFRGGLNV